MRADTLPSAGILSNGFAIRREAAKAISSVQIAAAVTPGGKTRGAATLQTFFTACATALNAIADGAAPTVSARVRNSATQITITFTDVVEPSVVPAAAAFAVTAGAVASVAVSGSTVVLTGTGLTVGSTVTYTTPAVNGLRDRAGNMIANFSGVTA